MFFRVQLIEFDKSESKFNSRGARANNKRNFTAASKTSLDGRKWRWQGTNYSFPTKPEYIWILNEEEKGKGGGNGAYFHSFSSRERKCVGGRAERAREKSRRGDRENGRRPKFVESLGEISRKMLLHMMASRNLLAKTWDKPFYRSRIWKGKTFTDSDLISWK